MKRFSTKRERLGDVDLIRDGAVSPLVAGDNAPIGSRYFGPGGEPWTKTGAVDTAWIQQLMMDNIGYTNVKDFGAVGDGVNNDRTAIGNAIAAVEAAGGGVVFFPPGTYNIVRTNTNPIYTFDTATQGKILLLGCGRSSVLSLSGDANNQDSTLFQPQNGAKYLGWKQLCFNAENLTNQNEQNHFINFLNQNGAPDLETGRTVIEDCYFEYIEGDSIRLLGNVLNAVQRVLIRRNVFQCRNRNTNHGGRSCVGFQRETHDITIDANFMNGVRSQLIDFEPTGNGDNRRMIITRNYLDGNTINPISNVKFTLSGNGAGSEHTRSIVTGNHVVFGCVSGLDCENLIFASNIINAPAADEDGTLGFNERSHGLIIADNIAYLFSDLPSIDTLRVGAHTVSENRDIIIDGNLLINATNLNGAFAITCEGWTGGIVSNNQLYVAVNTNNAGGLIRFEASDQVTEDIGVYDCMGAGTSARLGIGARAGASPTFDTGNVNFAGCLFRNVDIGLRFGPGSAAHRTEQMCATRNLLAATSSAVVVTGTVVPDFVIDANGMLNCPTIIQLTSAPEALVAADIGSFGLRTTGGAGSTLYVKEANAGGNTGWVAK